MKSSSNKNFHNLRISLVKDFTDKILDQAALDLLDRTDLI